MKYYGNSVSIYKEKFRTFSLNMYTLYASQQTIKYCQSIIMLALCQQEY